MDELRIPILQNTDQNLNQFEKNDSTIERVLNNIEQLISMLSNEFDENKSIINYSSQIKQSNSSFYYQLSSSTITNVTINDDNSRLIEHLRQRIQRLEHERNVLLTSYQLLIKLLK